MVKGLPRNFDLSPNASAAVSRAEPSTKGSWYFLEDVQVLAWYDVYVKDFLEAEQHVGD